MNNYTSLVAGLVQAVFRDILAQYPSMERELTNLNARLHSIEEERGLGFYTLTLPSIGKWFDRSISRGALFRDGNYPLHKRRSPNDTRPVFLHGLYSRVFDERGTLLAAPDPNAIFLLREVYYFAKKLRLDCSQEKVNEAISDFIKIEENLPRPWPNTWDSDVPTWSSRSGHPLWGPDADLDEPPRLLEEAVVEHSRIPSFMWDTFHRLCRMVSASFGEVDVWALQPKHGPGVVADSSKHTVKYDFENWPAKLENLFPFDWFGSHDLGLSRQPSSREIPSKMACVPKTQKGPRIIASEPTAHQWIQQGIRRWFEELLRRHPLGLSIDFRSQEYSRELARTSSLDQQYCTVDLSSASDRLSARLVEYVFQGNTSLLDALHACRSRMIKIPKELNPQDQTKDIHLQLRKYAPQGSACTFPVQSVIFTIIAHFAIMLTRHDDDVSLEAFRKRSSMVRVFGDDIIVPNDAYMVLTILMDELGLKVNTDKSFAEGFFREACGMDAFMGYCVTPAYILEPYSAQSPESLSSIVECSNNFYKKGLWHSADYLMKTVPEPERKLIPVSRKALGSLTYFTYGTEELLHKKRISRDFHREEALVLTLTTKALRRRGSGEASLLQYFTESPSQEQSWLRPLEWSAGEVVRTLGKKAKRWVITER